MWQCDFNLELSWRAGWWQSIMSGGTPEAEATFWGQLLIMTMKRRQRILDECCTWGILYSVYAVLSVYVVLGVNSWWWDGEIVRDDLTLCSVMRVELWTRKGVMWDEDENDVVDTSGYEISGVQLAWLRWEDHISVELHTGSGLVPAILGMVNWLAHEFPLRPSFSWWLPPSPLIFLFLVLNSTIT